MFNLKKALEAHKPANEIEAQHLKRILEFVNKENNLFYRTNLEGHIVGSGFLFSSDLKKVLLTHHKFLGLWLMFGGHSDGDENTMEVAQREVMEESGIHNFKPLKNYIFDVDAHRIPNNDKKKEPEHWHFDVRFAFVTDEDKFVVSDESTELKWFTLDEFKQIKGFGNIERIVKKWESLLLEKEYSKNQ